MESPPVSCRQIATTGRRVAQRLLTIGGNRFELLALEVQEERDRMLRALALVLGIAALGLLAAMSITAAIVMALWASSPIIVFLSLACVYAVAGLVLYLRLTCVLRNHHAFSATIDQLRKDRVCAEDLMS